MNINTEIAKTYIISNKKLTAVAAAGVVLGMSIYIFMNLLSFVSMVLIFSIFIDVRESKKSSKKLYTKKSQVYLFWQLAVTFMGRMASGLECFFLKPKDIFPDSTPLPLLLFKPSSPEPINQYPSIH